ncbi:Probable transposable element [Penicillium roqueforti FM164]|uniref:Probable transposable element n=1 Tax=Penicillium roqueforti (strain FM164) TaxID=1365484 RepID=W6R9B6_PENRF|nr:Probable transposable element [Penicillium roqueforti FM164]
MKGRYRLSILDGHGSHLTPKFDQICEDNDIIPICMPPHSSHLLQPLDIGCFAVLKRSYGRLVETIIRHRINHIDKLDFLEAYPSARIEAFKPETIKNSFSAAGLLPFLPDQVLSKLNICLRTPPPPSRDSDWDPKTPSNYIQLQKQASSIKALLRIRSRSPPSPLNSAINQVLKACQITMQSAAFLEKEVGDLRAANEKQKQKRTRSRRHIPAEEGLSVQETIEAPPPGPGMPGESTIQPRTRAPPPGVWNMQNARA